MIPIKKEPVTYDHLLKTPELGEQMKPADKQVHMWDVLGLPADQLNPSNGTTRNEIIQAVPQQEQRPSANEKLADKEKERVIGKKSKRPETAGMPYADEVTKFHFMIDAGNVLRRKLSEAQKDYENWCSEMALYKSTMMSVFE